MWNPIRLISTSLETFSRNCFQKLDCFDTIKIWKGFNNFVIPFSLSENKNLWKNFHTVKCNSKLRHIWKFPKKNFVIAQTLWTFFKKIAVFSIDLFYYIRCIPKMAWFHVWKRFSNFVIPLSLSENEIVWKCFSNVRKTFKTHLEISNNKNRKMVNTDIQAHLRTFLGSRSLSIDAWTFVKNERRDWIPQTIGAVLRKPCVPPLY